LGAWKERGIGEREGGGGRGREGEGGGEGGRGRKDLWELLMSLEEEEVELWVEFQTRKHSLP
jgi:hypothetical protein